jgi:hypothetical protein
VALGALILQHPQLLMSPPFPGSRGDDAVRPHVTHIADDAMVLVRLLEEAGLREEGSVSFQHLSIHSHINDTVRKATGDRFLPRGAFLDGGGRAGRDCGAKGCELSHR